MPSSAILTVGSHADNALGTLSWRARAAARAETRAGLDRAAAAIASCSVSAPLRVAAAQQHSTAIAAAPAILHLPGFASPDAEPIGPSPESFPTRLPRIERGRMDGFELCQRGSAGPGAGPDRAPSARWIQTVRSGRPEIAAECAQSPPAARIRSPVRHCQFEPLGVPHIGSDRHDRNPAAGTVFPHAFQYFAVGQPDGLRAGVSAATGRRVAGSS